MNSQCTCTAVARNKKFQKSLIHTYGSTIFEIRGACRTLELYCKLCGRFVSCERRSQLQLDQQRSLRVTTTQARCRIQTTAMTNTLARSVAYWGRFLHILLRINAYNIAYFDEIKCILPAALLINLYI
jgi:hypothetical protein